MSAPATGPDRSGRHTRPDAQGLLDYLTAHSLDEDYAFVARRRAAAVGDSGGAAGGAVGGAGRRRVGVAGAVALAVFALLLAVAFSQTRQSAGTDRRDRAELVGQVREARRQLDADQAEVRRLRKENARLQAAELSDSASALRRRLDVLGVQSGVRAVTGPGVRIVVDDAPGATSARNQVLDTDLQKLVNGLWEAGAEAVAINGQRVTSETSIRTAGQAITVNLRSLRRPYVVQAVGDRDTLPARFADTGGGQAWLDLHQQVGLRFDIQAVDDLSLPAGPQPPLRHARPVQTPDHPPDQAPDQTRGNR